MESQDGEEIIKLKDIQILFFLIKKLQFLLMAVFGMDTIVVILVRQITQSFGKRSASAI